MIDHRDRGKLLFLGSIAVAAVLVAAYLAAGGASYAPEKPQSPCEHRAWRNPEGLQQIVEQFSLSALDGAACKLGVSRETLFQALGSEEARERFAKRYDISEAELARAVRAGLLRAIDDAEEAGALIGPLASLAREAVRSVPLDQAIELINNAGILFEGGQSILGLGEAGLGLLEGFLPSE